MSTRLAEHGQRGWPAKSGIPLLQSQICKPQFCEAAPPPKHSTVPPRQSQPSLQPSVSCLTCTGL
jgi:hypothetical protein